MLDQSFSAKNFRKIFDYENRKGVYLESKFFPKVHNISNKITEHNYILKHLKKPADKSKLDKHLDLKKQIRENIAKWKREKEDLIVKALEEVSSIVTKKSFTIALEEKDLKGKKMYVPSSSIADYLGLQQDERNKHAAEYFALKQTQRNIAKLYKVKQADRYNIVCQLREILKEKFSKCIIKIISIWRITVNNIPIYTTTTLSCRN